MNKKKIIPLSLLALVIAGLGFAGLTNYNSVPVSANGEITTGSLAEVTSSKEVNPDSTSGSEIVKSEDSVNEKTELSSENNEKEDKSSSDSAQGEHEDQSDDNGVELD